MALGAVAPAVAVPTLKGATGLIAVPDTHTAQSASVQLIDGKFRTAGTKGFGIAEAGVLNREGRTTYNAKLALPEPPGGFIIPGLAVGIQGVAGDNVDREYYMVASKSLSTPQVTLSFGLSKAVSFEHGTTSSFYGLEWSVLGPFKLVADRDTRTNTTNAGLRFQLGSSIVIYDYLLDVGETTTAGRRNLIGACIQSQF